MYRLTSFRLVNWLHFTDITRPVSGTTLLTGENGEGKSTILDALQLALVADLREVKFNKAVGHTSRRKRSLKGYVLWAEKREEDDAPQRYRRASATAYVLLQFEDIPVPGVLTPLRPRFVCGVIVEAIAKGGEPNRTHIVVPGAGIEDLPVIDSATRFATPIRDFEAFVKQRRGATATSSADAYLDALRFQLGRLPKSLFPTLLTKGLAFKPMESVRDFVLEFLLEPRPIETGRLVENLGHYQEMQRESERASARLQALDTLVQLGDDVLAKERARDVAQFVYLRAELEDASREQAYQESLAAAKDEQHAQADERRAREEQRKDTAAREVDRLSRILAADDRVREKRNLEEEQARIENDIRATDDAERHVRENLGVQGRLLDTVLGPAVPPVLLGDSGFRQAIGNEAVIGVDPHLPIVREHRVRLNPEGSLRDRQLERWTSALGHIGASLGALRYALNSRTGQLRSEGTTLREQADRLAAGKVSYDENLEAFRYGLQQAVRRGEVTLKRPVVLLCELVDEVEAEWQDAVENWLGARRFDLIPDPQDYPAVNLWYERHRDVCPTSNGQTIRLYGVSVVNMERVLQHRSNGAAADPLSDVVRTSNPLAQAYVEYLLGRVQRCDSVAEFTKYDLAATRTGFLYRGFRTERVRPKQPVLGRAAREAERRRLDQQLAAVAKLLTDLGPLDQWLRTVEAAHQRAQQRWPLVAERLIVIEGRANLEARRTRVQQQLAAIDLSHVAPLEHELEIARTILKDATDSWLAARDEVKDSANDAENARKAGAAAAELANARTGELNEQFPMYDTNPTWDEHRSRFEERLQATGAGPKELATNYRRRHNAAVRIADDAWKAFAGARLAYDKEYEPILADTPVPVGLLRDEADRWRSTKLPEYARQIEERIAAARIQLLDDVLAQLHSHFADLRKALTMLNKALQSCMFGKDQYEFTWTPSGNLRPFHDLITELSPAFDLVGASGSAYDILEHNPIMRERLDLLLKALTDNRTNPLAGLESVRDYREYFDYDIRVMDGQGQIYHLSKNTGIASGGEVQTPTYVALFASLQQMYGVTTSVAAQCGLFLVDESFSLLDDRRIPALMSWVQQLGLQGVLGMPTGREAHFAPYADTILLVSRDNKGLGRVDDAHDLTRQLAQAS